MALVAVVGRPNVGKSTLVNRLASSHKAIVDEEIGVTRDRNYINTDWAGKNFTIIDTGGMIFGGQEELADSIKAQAVLATEEADAIIFVVDSRVGPIKDDFEIAKILRGANKPVFVVVNKVDDVNKAYEAGEFNSLGLGEPFPVSALHGLGTGDLLDELARATHEDEKTESEEEGAISVAIIGRPNVGKSSIFNRLIGSERVIVSDISGTTRDAIDTIIEREGSSYRFIDTAGLRKKSRIEGVEYYGMVRALRAIDEADIALLIIDAEEGVTEQDQKVADMAERRGLGIIVVLNKWDLVKPERMERIFENLAKRLRFIEYSPVIKVSALKNKGFKKVFSTIDEVAAEFKKEISTSKLNALVQKIKAKGHTAQKGGKRLNLLYATQVKTAPPIFLFFVNDAGLVDVYFKRYLTNLIRESFGFLGVPVILRFTGKEKRTR